MAPRTRAKKLIPIRYSNDRHISSSTMHAQLLGARCAPVASRATSRPCAVLPPRAALRLAPRVRARRHAVTPCAALPESLALIAEAAAASADTAALTPHVYEPPVVEPWQLWAGFVAGMAPFVIAGAPTPPLRCSSHVPLGPQAACATGAARPAS